MTATRRYELIRPIIHKEKTIQQVHEETRKSTWVELGMVNHDLVDLYSF